MRAESIQRCVATGDIPVGAIGVVCVETREALLFDQVHLIRADTAMWVWWFPDSALTSTTDVC